MLKHATEIALPGLPPGLVAGRECATPIVRASFREDVNRQWQSNSFPAPSLKTAPAPELKRAISRLSSIDTAAGTFAGYASLFGVPDLGGDVVVKGAFRRSLKRRGPYGVKLLFQHDPSQPIGVWLSIVEDHRGLYVRGRLMPEIAKAREVLALMRARALDGLSIGFRTVKGSRDPTTGLRHLHEIDLWEVSVVTFPMQPDARISAVKKASLPKAAPPSIIKSDRRLITSMRRAARNLHAASPSPYQLH